MVTGGEVEETTAKCSPALKRALGHIGLLLGLATYTLVGGWIFRELERPGEIARVSEAQLTLWRERRRFLMTVTNNSMDTRNLGTLLAAELAVYEAAVYEAVSAGISGVPRDFRDEEPTPELAAAAAVPAARWNLLQAVFFASTVLTTIGYGNVAPVTLTGRAFCVGFALVGIPFTLTVIADLGRLLAGAVASLSRKLRRLLLPTSHRPLATDTDGGIAQRGLARSLSAAAAVLMLLMVYISFGAALFRLWEDWTFFEGFYFCFITMTTIGFGDLVPRDPKYMLLCTLYILIGLALTSTIIELMRRQYAQSWQRMQELSARLQGLSGPLSEALKKLEVHAGDLGGLQDLRRLARLQAIALTRLAKPSNHQRSEAEWEREIEQVMSELARDQPRAHPVLQIIIYESAV